MIGCWIDAFSNFFLKDEGQGFPLPFVSQCGILCVQPIYSCNFHVQDKAASNKLLDNLKYNVEVAEKVANDAQVWYYY